MKKLILSLLIVTMLTGCVSKPVKQDEVTTTARTTVSKEQKPVAPDENSFSKYYDYINELCYEYEKGIDKNWQDYSSFPLPLYIGMCDVDSDETPEIMLGFLQPREDILYDVYSLKTKEKLFSFCGSIVDNPLCNKMYSDDDGNRYFMSYSSGELHDGKINAEKISFSGGKWDVVSGVENEGYSPDDEYKMIKSASIPLTSGENPLTDEVISDKLSELVAEYETVSGKFRKGMSIEDVKKVADTEECVFTDERLSKDYTYYKTYGENLEYRLWFSENGELSEIQIVAVKQYEKKN